MIILGIDPGLQITGYGIIKSERSKLDYITSGCIRLTKNNITMRLQKIFCGIREILKEFPATEIAVEQIFMHTNPSSALKLGQARGVAIVAASLNTTNSIAEYSARQIKQAVVGYGSAGKPQVQHMVKILLNLSSTPQSDAADALAVAICHAHTSHGLSTIKENITGIRKGRLREN